MVCCSSAARLPRPFHRLSRPVAAVLPPAFLAPRFHAQSVSAQSTLSAAAISSKTTSPNTAQNLKSTLRRLGQGSKWDPKPPTQRASAEEGKNGATRSVARKASASSDGQRSSSRDRNYHLGFRLRAKKLVDHLVKACQELEVRGPSPHKTPAEIDAFVATALTHFENEMKALRVMLKSKDVMIDPDNAWKSASRIKSPYNTAIRLCMQTGKLERAFKLLSQMKKDGIFPSAVTFTVFVNGLTRALFTRPTPASAQTGSESEALLQRKEVQRIREMYQDLEKLWKQAFPRYFQRSGAIKPKDALLLDKDNFHSLTEQARRNLISQQASVHEAREFPSTLTHAIGAYASFLQLAKLKDELFKLFDQLFPPALIDSMAKGLGSSASPQDKLELSNRKLSESLPLGNMTTMTTFLKAASETGDPDRRAIVESVWNRLEKLLDLERTERQSTPRFASGKRQITKRSTSNGSEQKSAVSDTRATLTSPTRFVPDSHLMTSLFSRLYPDPANADADNDVRLGLAILSKVYGLDLDSNSDGILREPHSAKYIEAFGHEHYLRRDANAIDELNQPVAELDSVEVASMALGMLARTESSKQCIALFNYLWARAPLDLQKVDSKADPVGKTLQGTAVFGSLIRPPSVMRIFWLLADLGDPVASRVLLDAMKRAAEAGDGRVPENRRARRLTSAANQSQRSTALSWVPSDICYHRALRSNLVAITDGPFGLTAATLEEANPGFQTTDGSKIPKQLFDDVWTETKSLLNEWYDRKGANASPSPTQARWGVDEAGRNDSATSSRRRESSLYDLRKDKLSRIHSDNVISAFLRIVRACVGRKDDKDVAVAREALTLLNTRIGLEVVVNDAKKLHSESKSPQGSNSTEAPAMPLHKVRSLEHLNKVISLALDTSNHSFAPKEDVELWKHIRKMLPPPPSSGASGSAETRPSSHSRDVRSRPSGGNRLLLSKDDYLELEAGASAEAEDDEGLYDAEQNPRGSYRMQRRSRHVEQELERWVRGASS